MNNEQIQIFTIGFTGKSAEEFFGKLKNADVRKVIDTRLWASSQLSGFAKKKDLPYFLKELIDAQYEYREELAPTKEILKAFQEKRILWNDYEIKYLELLNYRNVANILSPQEVNEACFLCACETEHQCHRRLLVEHLQAQWQDLNIQIHHL